MKPRAPASPEQAANRTSTPRGGKDRRDLAVICGALCVGVFTWLVYGIVDVVDIYGSALGGGWTVVWILMAAVGSLLAAGAVVLWHPRGSRGVTQRAGLAVAVVLVAVAAVVFFIGPVF